jgi:hypothetical protein
VSINDLHNSPASRLDENHLVVDHRVAISWWHPEFAWNGVKGYTCRRQHRAYRDRLVKPVGRSMFTDDIFTKTWTLVDAKETGNAACDPANHAATRRPAPHRERRRQECLAPEQ